MLSNQLNDDGLDKERPKYRNPFYKGPDLGNDINEAERDPDHEESKVATNFISEKRARRHEEKVLQFAHQKIIEEFGSEIEFCDSQCSKCKVDVKQQKKDNKKRLADERRQKEQEEPLPKPQQEAA